MTTDQRIEWNYRYTERIAIMCGDKEPTDEQRKIAKQEADEAVRKLSYEEP